MAVDSVNNNYNSALNDIFNNSKTNSGDKTNSTDSTGKTASIASSAKADGFSSDALSQVGLLNSGYLNYGSKGTYLNSSLVDFLNSNGGSTDNVSNLLDDNSQSSSDSTDLTNFLNGTDSSESQASQLESVFSSLADDLSAKDSQLINAAVARLTKKGDT